jgi:hypothetical protein
MPRPGFFASTLSFFASVTCGERAVKLTNFVKGIAWSMVGSLLIGTAMALVAYFYPPLEPNNRTATDGTAGGIVECRGVEHKTPKGVSYSYTAEPREDGSCPEGWSLIQAKRLECSSVEHKTSEGVPFSFLAEARKDGSCPDGYVLRPGKSSPSGLRPPMGADQ